jgi:cobalt-zinc-cadmium efflux system membrane fusion protein
MHRIAALALLLIGVAAGALLREPLSRLLAHDAGEGPRDNDAARVSPEARPKKDKRLVAVSADIAAALGIDIATAGPGALPTEVRVVGTVGFNEDKLARIVPRVPGTVRQVLKRVGDHVAPGEALAILDSKEIADARSNYLAAKERLSLAQTGFSREDELFKKQVSSAQDLIVARRELTQTRNEMRIATQTLLSAGLQDGDLKRLEDGPADLSRFDVLAPFAGEVVEKRIFVGEFLPQDREIFVMADLDVVWVSLQVSSDKLKNVAVGLSVGIMANDGLAAKAKIDYVAPVISDATRAARARVDVANPDHLWRPGAVVQALIEGPDAPAAVLVPRDALQTVDGQVSVFLPVADGFRLQTVTVGRSNERVSEILKGLKLGDKVATGQTFVLKSELEKGAGEDND